MSKRSQRGPEWKEWVSENAPRLLAYARQRCQDMAEAEDILQDTLIKLWHYQEERDFCAPDLPLAFSVMRYISLDRGRSKGRQERRNQKIVQFQSGNDLWLDTPAEDNEEAKLLRGAIGKLPEKLREVLTLKIWGGLTFAEIGKVLSLSNNTAASRYRYALEQLQKKLVYLRDARHG
ncbi:sigma-70 family RNA polymerase sigma factor [Akkermansiaceae bacterium]|nr:sigma-70 family RNA polymerase sigma factor [Akkermansiaceae bacterium]MDB4460941.1 sigma-70 family RNA polymerase sigma factor [bacterium]MDB4518312.1 sigma-70 family RNA polymerase sigma factor [Akkermansiaceae bacterium]